MSNTEVTTTDAFISYSRSNLDFVEQLASELAASGKEPWFDKSDVPLRGIPAGSEWWHEIEQGIEAADNFVFIISPQSVVSPYCNAEIAHAVEHSKRKIPIMLYGEDEASALGEITQAINAIPDEELIPEAIFVPERDLKKLVHRNWQRISAVQYIPFKSHDDWMKPTQELISALEQDIERVRALNELQRNAATWERQERSSSFLLRGEALREAEALITESVGQDPEPSPLQSEYVAAGRRDENRRRRITVGGVIASIMLIVAAIVTAIIIQTNAVQERSLMERNAAEERANLQATAVEDQAIIASTAVAAEAEAQLRRQQAEEALRVALSRQLAAQSAIQLDRQLDLALLLSVEAVRMDDTIEARSSLLDALSRSGALDSFLYGPDNFIQSLAFSPDGDLVASGVCLEEEYFGLTRCVKGGVFLWDINTRQLVDILEVGHVGNVPSLAFIPDGRLLAVGGCHEEGVMGGPVTKCVQGAVELWDVTTMTMDGPPLIGHRNESAYTANLVDHLTFSPDGRWLAASGTIFKDGWQDTITFWDLETRQPVSEPFIPSDFLSDLAFNPPGNLFAVSSSFDDAITLWPFSGGSVTGEPLILEIEKPKQLAFSPDGAILASTHEDDSITLWDVSSGLPIGEPLTATMGVGGSLAFSDDGQFLASTGTSGLQENDNVVTIWDVTSQKLVREFRSGTPWPLTQIAFSPGSHRLASGSRDGTILLWELDVRHPLATPLSADADAAMFVTFSPDGRLLASGANDGVVRLWDLASGEEVDSLTISETGGGVNSIAFSPDSKTIIACTWDWGKNVTLWDITSDVPVGIGLEGHKNEAFSVAFSPTGDVAASSAWDGAIIFRDPETGEALSEPLTDISPDEGSSFRSNDIWSIAFSPDGKLLASGRGGGDILLWDVATQQPAGEPFFAHTDTVMAVEISPDGTLLASGGGDWLIRFWEMGTSQPIGEPLAGHTDAVISLDFSPDGRTLASGGWDGTIRLWDVSTGQAIGQSIVAGSNIISSATFSPDGTTLATNADPITLWDMKIETWIERACRIANRNLTHKEWGHYLGEISYHETCPDAPSPDEN